MTLLSRFTAVSAGACLALAVALAGCSSAAAPLKASSAATDASIPAASAGETVPPYYAAVWAARSPAWDSPQDVTIRATATAKTLLTVRPPAPYQTFSFVAGTGVAGRWVAGAQRWHTGLFNGNNNASQFNQLYLLTYRASTGRASLTRLPVTPVQANQLIGNVTGPEEKAGTHLLAAVALSPDGRQLATVVTAGTGYQVQVAAVPGGTVRTWTAVTSAAYATNFSLTWLSDSRTLAVGQASADLIGPDTSTPVRYLNTRAPAGPLLAASRTVAPSFPPVPHFTGLSPAHTAPQSCLLPVAASNGTTIVCGGLAATGPNAGGYLNVGFWVLSAHTGKLTAIWAAHGTGGPDPGTVFPRIIWLSPDGRSAVLTGVTIGNQGSGLYIREPSGTLRPIPWPGFIRVPNLGNIVEPDVAW